MSTRTVEVGILSEAHSEEREQILELLERAYWMEIETVMNYIAASTNLDGIPAPRRSESH